MNPNSVGVEQLNTLLKTPMSREASGEDLLRRPEMTYELLTTFRLLPLLWKMQKPPNR